MASPSSYPFTSPDSPGDVHTVLVLLESSTEMLGCWSQLEGYYLPRLLGALQNSHPDIPMHIYWRTTADPAHQQPAVSASVSHVPALHFDAPAPLSIAALWRAVETLQAVCRDAGERTTRHLVVVAVTPPQDPANFHTQGGHAPEAATRDAVIRTLRQERMRLHMVLGTHPRFQPLRDFHRQMLRAQISVEAPVWFTVDPAQFSFHLAAKPAPLEGAGEAPLPTSAPRSGPVTPTSTAIALPAGSPQGSGSPREPASTTSPSRRTRAKGKDAAAAPSMETQGPGLVNYLKQVHGLTKKRNYGAKAGKRAAAAAAAAEPSRASTSSRPILPRLELPAANLAAITPRVDVPRDAQHAPPPPESAPPATSGAAGRYQPIAPALPLTATRALSLDDPRRAPAARRWPWLQPAPVAPALEAPALAPGTNAALRRLADMAPLLPPFNPANEQSARAGASGFAPHTVPPRPPQARQATYPPYGVQAGSSPSPPRQSPPQMPVLASSPQYHPGVPVEYHTATEAPPHTYHSPIAAHEMQQHAQMYAGQAHYAGYPYAVSPEAASPLPSPSATAAAPTRDDPENAPFVVTQEYEALANARFEAAVRSGAMQASMSPSVLSPVAPGPGGYFPAEPQADYAAYPAGAPLAHDAMHYPPAPGAPADPGEATYYQPQGPGADPSSSHWYGP